LVRGPSRLPRCRAGARRRTPRRRAAARSPSTTTLLVWQPRGYADRGTLGFGFSREVATLTLAFDTLRLPDGRVLPLGLPFRIRTEAGDVPSDVTNVALQYGAGVKVYASP